MPQTVFDASELVIDFDVVRPESGAVPILGVAFCGQFQQRGEDAAALCGESYKDRSYAELKASDDFKWAQQAPGLPMARATITHEVGRCSQDDSDSRVHKACFYALIVFPDMASREQAGETKFTVSGQTRPQGSITVRENKPVSGEAKRSQTAYFHFQVPVDRAREFDRLTFQLQTLHGDADLFVSRDREFPTMFDAEFTSSKAKGLLDTVVIEDVEAGDYFIGVHGQQESVFEFTVVPHYREKWLTKLMLNDKAVSFEDRYTVLFEGREK